MTRPPARLLAFDTATEVMAVAACGPTGRSAATAAGGAAASAGLLPLVEDQLAAAGLAFADLDAIAFGRGPGAFTGLRTSCAVAQGLGFGLGRPLLPIDSLLVVAEDARVQAGRDGPDETVVAVAMDARMDEVYAARYLHTAQRWRVLDAPALYTLPALVALVAAWSEAPATLLAGSAIAAFGTRLPRPRGAHPLPTEHDRAGALLRLAEAAWARGEGIDAALALPLYLRDKVALTTAERAAVRGAGSVDAAVGAAKVEAR